MDGRRSNPKPQANNTSGYRGVSWAAQNRKWRAQITVDGKNIVLGHFDKPKDAYNAYRKAKWLHHRVRLPKP